MTRPLIILGAGGHAKVSIAAARRAGRTVLLAVAPGPAQGDLLGVPVAPGDDAVSHYAPHGVDLVLGVGDIGLRRRLFDAFTAQGYRFATVVDPSAVITEGVILGDAVQVFAGAVIQPDCIIGRGAIINSRAVVEHDCRVGDFCHIAPGATVAGGVGIGANGLVGVGAAIRPGISLGADVLVGAGAAVVGDVADGQTVVGVPARRLPA